MIRLAELAERKKQKKLRQKENRLKERWKGEFDAGIEFDATVLAESSDSSSNSTDGSSNVDYSLESLQYHSKRSEESNCMVVVGSISIPVKACAGIGVEGIPPLATVAANDFLAESK